MTNSEPVRALVVDEGGPAVQTIDNTAFESLYEKGDTLVRVEWSSLNYKDAMALCGNRSRILRRFPIVPGIDLAGEVIESPHAHLAPGCKVLATGYGLGETLSGGYSSRARLFAEHLVPIPDKLDTRKAMQIGTAGFTAMLAVNAIRSHSVAQSDGPIAVTGASGGVGSQTIALLKAFGYNVTAITSKEAHAQYFTRLGANDIMPYSELIESSNPLDSQRWGGAIDTLGGDALAHLLSAAKARGLIVACGLAASFKLTTTVLPFILRGVTLHGVDSVYCPYDIRKAAWQDLARYAEILDLDTVCEEAELAQLPQLAEELLDNRRHGRILVKAS